MTDRMLESLGITETEETVYRGLLRLGRQASATALAEHVGLGLPACRRALNALEAKGLVSRSAAARRFVAARPDVAINVLASQRQEELERTKRFAMNLLDEYRQADPGDPAELLQIVSGREAVQEAFRQLQLSAESEVLTFDRPPYVTQLLDEPLSEEGAVDNPLQGELMDRGVRYRALYDREALEIPGRVRMIREAIARGESARVMDGVPMKLAIADESIALLPLSLTMEGLISYAIVVQAPPLILALRALFETLWRQAVPIPVGGDDEDGPSDREILTLLSAGLKDEAVARQVGLGTRTLRRRIATLMDELGARTRFQAGSQAALRGLIGGSDNNDIHNP
jgi:DNA-binding Lrp family transcriptional regulator